MWAALNREKAAMRKEPADKARIAASEIAPPGLG
jgi:hypothetical protein